MDGASDDEEEDQRIPNGDHSQNLREDDEDLMDPVDVRITSYLNRICIPYLFRSVRPLLRRMSGYRASSEVSKKTSPTPETTRLNLFA